MFFKKEKKSTPSSYQVGYSDGYNAGLRGYAKIFSMSFNNDRMYVSGYEQGYRKGITEYRNKAAFNKSQEVTPMPKSQPDIRRQTEAQREINLGNNNFRRW